MKIMKDFGVAVDTIKPVAWMSPDGKLSKTEGWLFHIPLYTAPHHASDVKQYRELSREEVRNVWLSLPYDPDNAPYLFAHAILKKASEK